jgi:hypothetical protein
MAKSTASNVSRALGPLPPPSYTTFTHTSPDQNQVFDLGDGFPSIMIPEPNVNFYAAWQPVRIVSKHL